MIQSRRRLAFGRPVIAQHPQGQALILAAFDGIVDIFGGISVLISPIWEPGESRTCREGPLYSYGVLDTFEVVELKLSCRVRHCFDFPGILRLAIVFGKDLDDGALEEGPLLVIDNHPPSGETVSKSQL